MGQLAHFQLGSRAALQTYGNGGAAAYARKIRAGACPGVALQRSFQHLLLARRLRRELIGNPGYGTATARAGPVGVHDALLRAIAGDGALVRLASTPSAADARGKA
jgi:hypothetical protein